MQLDIWTKDLADLRQRLAVAIAVLAVTQATRAAQAHARLSGAVARFEASAIPPEVFASELQAIQHSLVPQPR
ncbi:hypothetical protein E6C64_05765 [Naasia lichenicola]|uniref:Uncharacterized protein n=2 Tax=Naasia lichenicola TaxID=2565933 RepID=A0A4S4FMF0_9MICO|nr:hypothetical protein E6C64_05765 [Naasia lichenicola]